MPGIVTQPRSNGDRRPSIRGFGLTRNGGSHDVTPQMDGVPIDTSDGLFDVAVDGATRNGKPAA
ncbi:hypothetical protein [Azospirillum argentinense]